MAWGLVEPWLQVRPLTGLTDAQMQSAFALTEMPRFNKHAADVLRPNITEAPKYGPSKKRCVYCIADINRTGRLKDKESMGSSKALCQKCGKNICTARHMVNICTQCYLFRRDILID